MKQLKSLLPFNYFHYYAFSILIGILSYEKIYFIFLYIPFYYLIKNYKNHLVVLLIGLCFFISLFLINEIKRAKPLNKEFLVTEKSVKDNYYLYVIKQGRNKYLLSNSNNYEVGDVIVGEVTYEEFTKEKTPFGFNYKKYYSSLRIFYKVSLKNIKVVDNKFTLNKIKYNLMSHFENYPPVTKSYIYTLIFANNSFDSEFKENLSKLGISHLFALSGFHLSFLIIFLDKLFNKFAYKETIILVILTSYLIILNFPISLLRAYLMYLFSILFKKEAITTLDCISLSFIVMLSNPYLRYHYSFILSFLVSFFIIIVKGNFLKIAFVSYLVSLPFLINFNNSLLLYSFPISLLISYLFPLFIFPLTIISLFPLMNAFSEFVFSAFNLFTNYVNQVISFKMPSLSLLVIFLYFTILIFVLLGNNYQEVFKRSKYLISFIVLIYFFPVYNFQGYVYFLDVNQGDATFIQRPFNKANILIDCNKGTYQFLKTKGNIEIDYLFITHSDLDHMSDLYLILEEFKVNNIYINKYEEKSFKNSLIKYNYKEVSEETILIDDITISVFGPLINYDNKNDNSLILKLSIDNETYLFTGDSSFKREKDLIKKGSEIKSDYLHVAHHGAANSTSSEFLKVVKPSYAIISSGINNYNHPHPETIERIKKLNVEILMTKTSQTIIIKKYSSTSFFRSFVIQRQSFSV